MVSFCDSNLKLSRKRDALPCSWLHPFLTCLFYFSFSTCNKVSSGVYLSSFTCVCLFCRWWVMPSPSWTVSVIKQQHRGKRISAQPVNKTLSLLNSVGESSTVVLVWYLCRLITRVKGVLSDHLSLWAAHLSCCVSRACSQGWTVSGSAARLSGGSTELQSTQVKSTSSRLKMHTWLKSHVIIWKTLFRIRTHRLTLSSF